MPRKVSSVLSLRTFSISTTRSSRRQLRAIGHRAKKLNVRQLTGFLLRLCTSSQKLVALFNHLQVDGCVPLSEWLEFIRDEQVSEAGNQPRPSGDDGRDSNSVDSAECPEVVEAQKRYEDTVGTDGNKLDGLTQVQFALQLLSPLNDAVGPSRDSERLQEPIFDFWNACTHNSCTAVALELTLPAMCTLHRMTSPLTAADIVGDQLTGISSADAYRRQLLQVRRPKADLAPAMRVCGELSEGIGLTPPNTMRCLLRPTFVCSGRAVAI
jgi:hypothetical protein